MWFGAQIGTQENCTSPLEKKTDERTYGGMLAQDPRFSTRNVDANAVTGADTDELLSADPDTVL